MTEPAEAVAGARETLREVLVVVGSILIAFALDAWWDGVTERRTLRDRIPDVVAEMEEARRELHEGAIAHEIYRRASAELYSLLAGAPEGATVAVPDTLIGMMYSHFVMDVPTSVTERFIEVGGLTVVEDDGTVTALNGWPRLMQDAVDDQAQLRFEIQTMLLPLVARAGRVGMATEMGRTAVGRGRAAELGTPPPEFPRAAGEVDTRVTAELVNMLGWRASTEGMRSAQMEALEVEQARLIAALEGEARD